MLVLDETLNLYKTSNMIFLKKSNENHELSFVTLTFYLTIYA